MADQAVDVVLVFKVKGFCIGHAISGMTLGTHTFIALGVGTEVIDDNTFTKLLAGRRICVFPGPVLIMNELIPGFVVTAQACFGDRRAIFKWSL